MSKRTTIAPARKRKTAPATPPASDYSPAIRPTRRRHHLEAGKLLSSAALRELRAWYWKHQRSAYIDTAHDRPQELQVRDAQLAASAASHIVGQLPARRRPAISHGHVRALQGGAK